MFNVKMNEIINFFGKMLKLQNLCENHLSKIIFFI
jgi:hypothetical protein